MDVTDQNVVAIRSFLEGHAHRQDALLRAILGELKAIREQTKPVELVTAEITAEVAPCACGAAILAELKALRRQTIPMGSPQEVGAEHLAPDCPTCRASYAVCESDPPCDTCDSRPCDDPKE